MAATTERLKGWFDVGINRGARWMVVICDTFDHDDYPVYFEEGEKKECGKRIAAAEAGENMQQLMEVYDFSINKEDQFREVRAMHRPK
jgi:hypothetical protein